MRDILENVRFACIHAKFAFTDKKKNQKLFMEKLEAVHGFGFRAYYTHMLERKRLLLSNVCSGSSKCKKHPSPCT